MLIFVLNFNLATVDFVGLQGLKPTLKNKVRCECLSESSGLRMPGSCVVFKISVS